MTETIFPYAGALASNQPAFIAPATVNGTTTNAYVVALTLSCPKVARKTIILANTHATLTLKYRVRGFAKSGSTLYDELFVETTLAASTMVPLNIEKQFDVVTVEVIDGSGHATYTIDYVGGS